MQSPLPAPHPKNPVFPWDPIVVGNYYYGFLLIFGVFSYISEKLGPSAKTDFRFRDYIKKILNTKEKKSFLYAQFYLNYNTGASCCPLSLSWNVKGCKNSV